VESDGGRGWGAGEETQREQSMSGTAVVQRNEGSAGEEAERGREERERERESERERT